MTFEPRRLERLLVPEETENTSSIIHSPFSQQDARSSSISGNLKNPPTVEQNTSPSLDSSPEQWSRYKCVAPIFSQGLNVSVRFPSNFMYYPATVMKVDLDSRQCDVQFADGDIERGVSWDLMRPRSIDLEDIHSVAKIGTPETKVSMQTSENQHRFHFNQSALYDHLERPPSQNIASAVPTTARASIPSDEQADEKIKAFAVHINQNFEKMIPSASLRDWNPDYGHPVSVYWEECESWVDGLVHSREWDGLRGCYFYDVQLLRILPLKHVMVPRAALKPPSDNHPLLPRTNEIGSPTKSVVPTITIPTSSPGLEKHRSPRARHRAVVFVESPNTALGNQSVVQSSPSALPIEKDHYRTGCSTPFPPTSKSTDVDGTMSLSLNLRKADVATLVGLTVEANFLGHGWWFPGVIIAENIEEGTVDIRYEDGDVEMAVPLSLTRSMKASSQQNSTVNLPTISSLIEAKPRSSSTPLLKRKVTLPVPSGNIYPPINSTSSSVTNSPRSAFDQRHRVGDRVLYRNKGTQRLAVIIGVRSMEMRRSLYDLVFDDNSKAFSICEDSLTKVEQYPWRSVDADNQLSNKIKDTSISVVQKETTLSAVKPPPQSHSTLNMDSEKQTSLFPIDCQVEVSSPLDEAPEWKSARIISMCSVEKLADVRLLNGELIPRIPLHRIRFISPNLSPHQPDSTEYMLHSWMADDISRMEQVISTGNRANIHEFLSHKLRLISQLQLEIEKLP